MPAVLEQAHTDAEIRAESERILQSRAFKNSTVLRSLLTYLIEKFVSGEGDTIKEYSIGLDVLGKPESFDPRQESVVRMHTARLRQKLTEYYSTEGAADALIIGLPKGGFKITVESAAVEEKPAPQVETPKTGWSPRELVLGGALIVALAVALFAVAHSYSAAKPEGESGATAAASWTPELRELWEPMISPARRLVICMATPLFVDIPGFGTVRDSSINDWDNVPASKRLAAVENALSLGMSEPSWNYTEAGTATGAFLLGQFLAPRRQNVVLTRASVLSWPEIAEDNVVFLGSPNGIHQVQDIPVKDAQVVLEAKGIRNLHPRPGEPEFLTDKPGSDGEESGLSYALVSRLPSMNGHGAVLMLSGNEAASVTGSVQAFTSPALAKAIVAKLRSQSGKVPVYFQLVLRVKSMDDVPVDISYVLHREMR